MVRVRTVWIVQAAIAIVLIAGVVWVLSPAVPQRKLDRLVTGMSLVETERLLGRPVENFKYDEGTIVWRYTSRFHSGYVDIFFEKDGRYREYNYESFSEQVGR